MLADNVDQNDLMGTSRANAASLLPVHARQIKDLVAERGLNRELEALPSEKEIRRRTEVGLGLTSPELATLMAHVKLALKDERAGQRPARSGGVRRPAAALLPGPAARPLRRRDPRRTSCAARSSPRCWSTTSSTPAGSRYAYRITEDVGVGPVDAVRTYVATDAIFGIGEVWRQIRAASDAGVPVARHRPHDAGPAPADRPRRHAGCSTTVRSRWPSAPRSTGSPPRWPR